jgi:galactitol-specific phosphotransferase system IIC component
VSILVAATLIITMNTYINDVKSITTQQSKALAQQTFSDMFQIMKTDWTKEQLEDFLKSLETAHKNSNTEVYLYRGKLVDELFGKINKKKT